MFKKMIYALLCGIVVFVVVQTVLLQKLMQMPVTDRAAINAVVKITEQHWDALNSELYAQSALDFTILDNEGTVRFQTRKDISATINDAVNHRDTMLDLTVDRQTVGKVIFDNNNQVIFEQWRTRLAVAGIWTALLLFLLGLIYALYLNRSILRPFRRLQRFAKQIAKGNLDVPLEMDRNHLFGAFTESFDMMREELAAARQSEYRANKSKKELVASLSHDIKTPVASIKALTELMLIKTTDEKTSRQLHTLYAKADQIDRLVTDMFHSTLEELNELQVHVQDETSSILNKLVEEANFYERITTGVVPECLISVDPLRLQQVLDNVVSNSYKYAGTSIVISFTIQDPYLEVEIRDYGPGVQEDELPLIFNKFYRGSHAGNQIGSGLGLTISRNLMRGMGGELTCRNLENGFVMTMLIPLVGVN
ncbi:ATP-binding protein [Paenibacillus sp. QZ-Y1]|uniref:sensor histidine kinase n=1 Tax=Paenibacillus sp. QZ-Y1 TaxID=3414511 RepID=UPI003F7AD0A2